MWFWGWGLWVGRTGRIDSIAGLHWVAAGRPCGHGGAVNLDRLASILLLVIRAWPALLVHGGAQPTPQRCTCGPHGPKQFHERQ